MIYTDRVKIKKKVRGGRGQNIIYKKSGDSGAKSVKNNLGGGQVDDGVKIVQKGCRWTISVRLKMNRKVTRAQDLNLNKRVSRSGRLFLENWNMGMRRATGNGQRMHRYFYVISGIPTETALFMWDSNLMIQLYHQPLSTWPLCVQQLSINYILILNVNSIVPTLPFSNAILTLHEDLPLLHSIKCRGGNFKVFSSYLPHLTSPHLTSIRTSIRA